MIISLIISLVLTIILEVVLSYLLGIKKINDIKLVIFVNIYTNPIVVFLSNIILIMNNMLVYYITVFILEIGAIIIETILYKRYLNENVKHVYLSIYNNIFSFSIGLILNLILRM